MIMDPKESISDTHEVGIGKNDVSSCITNGKLLLIKIKHKIAWGMASPRFSNSLSIGTVSAGIPFVTIWSLSITPFTNIITPTFSAQKGVRI